MSLQKFNEEIIYKYLTGDASDNERHLLEVWLEESKTNRHTFASIKKTFIETSAQFSKRVEESNYAYEKFLSRVEERYNSGEYYEEQNNIHLFSKILQYAAVFLLIIGFGIAGYLLGKGLNETDSFTEVIVPYGSRTNIILPDGTKLWLNAGSKLKYEKTFDKKSRDVYLEGEAYFEVEKKKIPFIVHTSHFDIKVLGTTFNVKSYSDDENIETTLVEGSILVESPNNKKKLLLKPHQKLVFNKLEEMSKIDTIQLTDKTDIDNKKEDNSQNNNEIKGEESTVGIIENNVNVEKSICWKDGTLIFDRESLDDLAKKLERKFNITIEFENDKIRTNSYTGTLRDIPLEQVLEALKLTSEIRYHIKGNVVKLY